jgi:hypothetical protein
MPNIWEAAMDQQWAARATRFGKVRIYSAAAGALGILTRYTVKGSTRRIDLM